MSRYLESELGVFIASAITGYKRLLRNRAAPEFVRIASHWLRDNKLVAIQSDKDGVFVLTTKALLKMIIFEKLSERGGCYIERYLQEPLTSSIVVQASTQVSKICGMLRKLG